MSSTALRALVSKPITNAPHLPAEHVLFS